MKKLFLILCVMSGIASASDNMCIYNDTNKDVTVSIVKVGDDSAWSSSPKNSSFADGGVIGSRSQLCGHFEPKDVSACGSTGGGVYDWDSPKCMFEMRFDYDSGGADGKLSQVGMTKYRSLYSKDGTVLIAGGSGSFTLSKAKPNQYYNGSYTEAYSNYSKVKNCNANNFCYSFVLKNL